MPRWHVRAGLVKDTIDSIGKGAGGFVERLTLVRKVLDFNTCMAACIAEALRQLKGYDCASICAEYAGLAR